MIRLLAVFILALTKTASADVTYYFSGALSQDIGGFTAGTPFSGSLSYTYPQQSSFVLFYSSFELEIGGQSVQPAPVGTIIKAISLTSGILSVKKEPTVGQWLQINSRYIGFGLSLVDDQNQDLFDGELPADGLRLNHLANAYLWMAEYDASITDNPPLYAVLYGKTTEVQSALTTLVPEPSSLSLLLAGGAVLMAGRRKR